MADLRELYQEVILEHSKAPRNYRELATASHSSKASASMMTQSVKGKTRAEAETLFDRFHKLVTGQLANGRRAELGKLAVFSGVSEFPVRVKCATLAWHALHAAMRGKHETVSTE